MDLQNEATLQKSIEHTLASQRFGVLTTEGRGQPYASLVAFADTGSLNGILFVTGRATRKFLNMQSNSKVAILVDSRSGNEADVANAIAVTALGTVHETSVAERGKMVPLYICKHPSLEDFANASDNALMLVDVAEFYLASFNRTWRLELKHGNLDQGLHLGPE